MKRRGLRLLIALGVGGGLVGLAVAALVSPNVLRQRPTERPYWGESYSPPDVSVSEAELRSVGWYSLYLVLAAVPCLLTALIHYRT